MGRLGSVTLALFFVLAPAFARHELSLCGTSRETSKEVLFLHRQAVRRRALRSPRALAPAVPSLNRDMGDIAIIEDTDGVVERLNQFDLGNKTLTFTPAANASQYTYSAATQGYDAAAATMGAPLAALDDDDTRAVSLPFAFPFFGATYNQVFVNSDGNLTFMTGDNASTDRSLGRFSAGPPRIAPLFDDLNPAQTAGGVRVVSEAARLVVSWVAVPEYQDAGNGTPETFQVKLYPDGRIEFSYSAVSVSSAVVGIAPGNLVGTTSLVSYSSDASGSYQAGIAERFGNTLAVDTVTVAQKFYQTHDDSYDYLVIYNNMGIAAQAQAVAYESTVRNVNRSGYGDVPTDTGQQYGSASRLQAVLNMGDLTQYPVNPNGIVPARAAAGDTPLTVIGHEAGHLFLAYASIRDPNDPSARPMLGAQLSHWNFVFNSEASLLEGERIMDQGSAASPRFLTTDTVQDYAPLDQYLMGFRPPSQVPDTFLVTNPVPSYVTLLHPLRGFGFDGVRKDVAVQDIIQAEGRRTPDDTVAQRHFRFAFILVVAAGSQPSADDIAQIDTYRRQFETFYAQASSNNATAGTSLKRSLKLSLEPAGGVVAGGTGPATVTIQTPSAADLTVQFQTPNGDAQFPAAITIPAGSTSANLAFTGLRPGVEDVTATPLDNLYETAFARVQVAGASVLTLLPVSGDQQVSTGNAPLPDPVVVQLTDVNRLAYPGARVNATVSAGGSVTPASVLTDAQGRASFRWTPGTGSSNQLLLSLESAPSVTLALHAGSAVPTITGLWNAASFDAGVAPGSLATITGVNLAGGQTATAPYPWPAKLAGVHVVFNGEDLPLLYVSDSQINLYIPADVPVGTGTLTVTTPSGAQSTTSTAISAVAPGIFSGAVLVAGTGKSAAITPVHAGDYVEIYCTGLGPTRAAGSFEEMILPPTVFIGGAPAVVTYSGLAPGFAGLYQVNAQVPPGLAPGPQTVLLSVALSHSNNAAITVQ
ncbi:MAG TPA: hypothetical protein VG675_02110 [Bryobacteraceae bacterium]|nr:hypothetical protein [Bryobacteraceae bacterium]